MNFSRDLSRYYASGRDDILVHTIELYHPSFVEGPASDGRRYYFCNQQSTFTSLRENGANTRFEPAPFSILLPTQDSELRIGMQLQFDVVDVTMIQEMDRAAAAGGVTDDPRPVSVTYRIYLLSKQGRVPEWWVSLIMRDVAMTDGVMSGELSRADVVERAFPRLVYNDETFPALGRN